MNWTDNFDDIIIYSKELINRFDFNIKTAEHLMKKGLPNDAPPFLSFVKNNTEQYEGMLELTKYFDFLESEFAKYIVIGSDGNGDLITIDTKDDCKVKMLDHENNFAEQFMNNSIYELREYLNYYQDFIHKINDENGENAYFDSNYTIGYINDLKTKMKESDADGLKNGNYWNSEMDILIESIEG